MTEEKLYQDIWRRKETLSDGFLPSRAAEALNVLKSANILLDIGCGDGTFAARAKDKYQRVIGLDLSRTALRMVGRQEIFSLQTNINRGYLPLKNKSVDVVSCLDVVEHVFDPYYLLNEIFRVLTDQGEVILTPPNTRFIEHISAIVFKGIAPKTSMDMEQYDGGHLHYFTFKDIERILDECSFKVILKKGIALRFYRSFKTRAFYLCSKLWEKDPLREFFNWGILIKAVKK